MNTKEVYINGILIDLDEENNPIELTYAINDLAELKDRQAYGSNTFKIPPTQNNLVACGFPNSAQLIQTQPYRKNTGKIVQGGIEVLTNGIAIITKAGVDIEVQILAGLVGFFDLLGDKKISDLDLSAYDHVWNVATAAGSQNNTGGFIYPVIDYGGLSETDKRADVRQLRPATFRKTIIEAIISEAGYIASGNYQSYDKYLKSLVAFSNDKFTHGEAYKLYLAQFITSARNTNAYALDSALLEQTISLNDHASTDPSGSWDGGALYTAPVSMRATVKFKYSITQTRVFFGGSTPENVTFIQQFTGGVWVNIAQNITTSSNPIFTAQDFIDQLIQVDVDLSAGDNLRILVLQQPGPGRIVASVYPGAQISIDPIVEEVTYGADVQLAATLPDVSQKNFFKDFLQNFGLIVIPDNYKKELLLINMEDVYNNIPYAEDITDKLFDSEDDNSFALNGYGINNYGKYKEDDAVTDGLGDGLMIFDNLTLDDNVTLFTSIFAASEEVIKLGGVAVAEIKKIEDVAISSAFKLKTEPRILLNNKLNTTFEFYGPEGSQNVSAISVPRFAGLSYQILFDENYPEILQMLYRPYLSVKQILLKQTDIAKLDWRLPVYDKKSASYYYKNEIKYIQNDISTISLIRLAGKFVDPTIPVRIEWLNGEPPGILDIDIKIFKNSEPIIDTLNPGTGEFYGKTGDAIRVEASSVSGSLGALYNLVLNVADGEGNVNKQSTPGVPGAFLSRDFICAKNINYYYIEAIGENPGQPYTIIFPLNGAD